MNRSLPCIAVILILCSIAGVPAQDKVKKKRKEAPRVEAYKVKTELMEVRTIVMDRKSRIVEDLKKEDFELLENDKPQEISFFSISKLDDEQSQPKAVIEDKAREKKPGTPVAIKPGAEDKAVAFQRAQQRLGRPPARTTLLFVDTLHMSFSNLNRVKQALRSFIRERLIDEDMVALAASGQTLGIAQQFTRDRQLLNYAIERIRLGPVKDGKEFTPNLAAGVMADRLDAFRLAVDIMRGETGAACCSMLRLLARQRALQVLAEASYYRKSTVSILKDFAEQMISLPGKRMIVVFSDGFTLYDSDSGIHPDQLQPAINRAVRSGVVIYTIDAKGLQAPPTLDAAKRPATTYASGSSQNSGGSSCPGEQPNPICFAPDAGAWEMYVYESEREEQNGLYALADQTGGKMYTNHNDLVVPLAEAFNANRFYYVLSYYLQPGSNRVRSIKVRVRDHPEYTVKTFRGYSPQDTNAKPVEEAETAPQQRLIWAMNTLLPLTQLNVSAKADFLESEDDDKKVTLTVDFDGDKFQYREQDQRNVFGVEILSLIYDASGNQVEGISAQVEGTLTAKRLEKAKTSGYRFSRRLALKPGVYQVRIGVREEGTDRIGTAVAWVEVPEPAREELEMSSLILLNPDHSNSRSTESIDVGGLEQIRMVQGIPVYGRDIFCDYWFRVREGKRTASDSELFFVRELLKSGKPIKQEEWLPIFKEEKIIDSKGWFEVHDDMDLSRLDPGIYELRVSLKDAHSNKTVQRTAVFSVE